MRSSWSEPQSAPGLTFADYLELLHLFCKEYKQSDFGIGHLVMSMCSIFSCVVGRGCLLWPVHSLEKTLLVFLLLNFVLKAKFACYYRYLLISYFCIPVSYNKTGILLWVLVLEGLVILHRAIKLWLLLNYWLGYLFSDSFNFRFLSGVFLIESNSFHIREMS